MHHKRAIRVHSLLLWLVLSTSLSAIAWADSYDDAMAALAAGDYRVAYRDLKRLARQERPKAQYQLGLLYLSGHGVEADRERGIEWLKHAAGNGSHLAANELGQIYLTGRGVPPDAQEAKKWVELATRLAGQDAGQEAADCE